MQTFEENEKDQERSLQLLTMIMEHCIDFTGGVQVQPSPRDISRCIQVLLRAAVIHMIDAMPPEEVLARISEKLPDLIVFEHESMLLGEAKEASEKGQMQ